MFCYKLAQFRQRKGQTDSQASSKKTKKKKTSSGSKHREQPEETPEAVLSHSDEAPSQTAQSGASTTAEFTIMRTLPHGEIIKHDKTYTIEPESEVSTTADDYSSEVVGEDLQLTANSTAHTPWEEEFEVRETFSEQGTQSALSRLEVMEDELVGKQQEIEELNRELEEMRAAYGTEGLQQLQEFETAIKQRDGIITQLTTNLQQARKEKDDIMREFLELTEQSQKLKIQFQHLQASETLRNTSHSSTAADLLHSKQQIITYQQQLEERDHRQRLSQKEIEELRAQVTSLQHQVHDVQQVQQKELELSYEQRLNEKDLLLDSLKSSLHNEEIKSLELKEKIAEAEKSVDELKAQLTQKSQEISSLSEELSSSRQKERRSSDEIKQLMGTVEDLQKKHYRDSQSEAGLLQRMELETQRKLEQLQAELDEVHGQQIVQMKQELVRQHTLEIERLLAQHRQEVSSITSQAAISTSKQQINELNVIISELNARLQQTDEQREKMKEDFSQRLQAVSKEKSQLQKQIEDLLQDLSYAREQVHKARESITEKENKLNEANSLFVTIDNLKAELAAANEFTKELESKHEAEVTNYKIKLEMMEREKDAVLDRMAESQEAELEKLRTHFLFSQEEELTKLREDLTREHRTNIENIRDNLEVQNKQKIDQIKQEMSQTITAMQSEKDGLITKQNYLMLEISTLKDLLQSVNDPKSEQMMIQINDMQKELECLRKEEKEKGTVEQEVQVLQLRIETLEREVKEKDTLKQKVTSLETDNKLLKDQYDALQNTLKECNVENGENLTDSVSSDHLDLKNMIELLTSENAQLKNQEHQLRVEIERQKNTFSFAEKNFEVNYNELKEEYSCLVKLKEQLEDSKAKLEDEYKTKLNVLNNELVMLKPSTVEEAHLVVSRASNLVKADKSDIGEVIEKDTTELMEKLETAQRDKQELSLKLSSLSEELQLKQNEISQLKEQLHLLCLERDGTKIEEVVLELHSEATQTSDNVHIEHSIECSLVSDENSQPVECLMEETIRPTKVRSHSSPQSLHSNQESADILIERESLLQRLDELSRKLEEETSVLGRTCLENEELRQKLNTVLQEQADTALQLEAQHISLTQIHKAQLELISNNFESEKKNELCSLRETLLQDQEEKTRELLDQHQRQLETLQSQDTGYEGATCQDLTQRLMKRICNECADIIQVIGEETEKTQKERREDELTYSSSLALYRTTVHTLQNNLSLLLEKFVEEYKQMASLSRFMEKTEDLQVKSAQPDIPHVKQIVIVLQDLAPNQSDVQEGLTLSPSQEAEKLKVEFSQQRAQLEEKHCQEIEHLRSYFQQQLKENEERFSKEIIHLQEQLQDVSLSPLQLRDLCENETAAELGLQEGTIFQSVYASFADILKVDETAQMGDSSLRTPIGPIYQELQSLRHALFSKYVEEVCVLKKQHKAELDQLRADLTERFSVEREALRQEILQLTSVKQETVNVGFQPTLCPITEEKSDADLNQLVEERYQEKIEQEVARVIVEMSIAFAQQTELARLSTLEVVEQQNNSQDQSVTPEQDEDSLTNDAQAVELEQEGIQEHNQIATMGAEATKFKQMYEERVEEMRQELVRQEQEYQQATEALRLAHAAQLERQMYDQEQLLSEVHRLRAQLTENASAISEIQATEREKILLEELESMKKKCAEVNEWTQDCILQDNSSQTQYEPFAESENREKASECGQGEGEKGLEENNSATEDSSGERKNLKRVNKRLLKILLEIVKTTVAVEETIGRHVVGLLDKSGRRYSTSKVVVWNPEQENLQAASAGTVTVTDTDGAESCSGVKYEVLWSEATKEDLDVSMHLTEADFPEMGINPEEETQVLNISGRLQSAVEKLLEAINETSNQLEHAKAAQTELVRESLKRKQETTDLLRCQEELQERLGEEAKAREHLALELSKAEGLLDGYTDERVFLEKQMQEKNDLIRHLEQELQSTGNRLQELEQERQQIQEEKELLSRQKLALKASAAPAEQRLVEAAVVAAPKEELLEETEKLLKEKIEVQRQAEKDSGDLHKQVKVLEVELEEQVSHNMQMEQEKNAVLEDLRQKNLSLEKQLEKTRRFLDEQAVDREHERDVFQQEIQKLEQQLKMPQRHQPVNDHQSIEVEKLESHLKEKTDKCSELLLCKEQLQRDVQERNEEIEKLECRIRELEQALLISADTLQKVEDRRPSLAAAKGEMPLEAQLQVEREAIDRKEKEITNLVEQLEQFREELENKNEEVQQLHMQLEIQRKESATRLQELEQENKVLKDELEMTQPEETPSATETHFRQGKIDNLSKDQEFLLLNEQIAKLHAQLEAATDNKVIEEKNEQIKQYKSQIKCLKSDQERLKKNSEEEIEKLNEVIEKLQEELSQIDQKVTVSFTGMSEITEGSTYLRADSPSLADMNVDNTVLDHMEGGMKELNSAASSPVVQSSVQDMESTLKQLQETVKEKDLNLKQYYEQVMTLNEEIKVLNETVERLKQELATKDQKINSDVSKNLASTVSPETSAHPPLSSTDDTLLNNELETTKAELKQVKEELEKLRTSSENTVNHQLCTVSSQEEIDINYTTSIENLTEALREKTAQHVAVEALLVSVQETSQDTIHNLQCQVQDLQKTIQRKESQLQELASSSQLPENQEVDRLNEVIRRLELDLKKVEEKITEESKTSAKDGESQTTQNETPIANQTSLQQRMEFDDEKAMLSNEVEDAKKEVTLLKEELKNLRKSQKQSAIPEENGSSKHGTRHSDLNVTVPEGSASENTEQAVVVHSLPADTEKMQTGEVNIELQLQELKEVIKVKDAELLQYVTQKELLQDQALKIEQLNEEIRKLKQDLAEASSDFKINPTCVVTSTDMLEKTESDELAQPRAELEKREMDVSKAADANACLTVADLEKALNEKAAELLESQKLNVSLEETTQATVHKMELQLQEFQKVIEQKDLELQQYVQQKDLRNQQMKEVEELNEVVRTLQQQLAQSGSDIHSREELVQIKAELEKAKTDLAVLKEELSKVNLTEKLDIAGHENTSRESEAALKVNDLEQTLREKTAELLASQAMLASLDETTQATIHSLESKLQELQNAIQLKDLELLQYVNQKDLIDQQTKEIERLGKFISMNEQNSEDIGPNVRKDGKGFGETLQENELFLQNRANLEDSELAQTKAELERTKLELSALTEEISQIRLSSKNEDMPDNGTPREDKANKLTDLEQALKEKTADLLASQTILTSLQETSQASMHNMELQLQELRKTVQQKDSELLQYLNQQNILNQQTKEIELLNGVIESLQKQLEDAQQRTYKKSESTVNEGKSKNLEKELTEQMNGGETTFIKTLDTKSDDEYEKPFGQLYNTRERIHPLDSGKRMSDGDVTAVMENKDQCDWMIEALRDQNTQLLENQSLFTSMQETMQSTIDTLETQLEDLQKVVKEKDMEILLYLEEIETLNEQVKVKKDEHDQIVLAMEDSLREKVAAALVSEAQLKAIQFHTKCVHSDDTSSALVEESKMLQTHSPRYSPQEESESKSSVLNLQLLELEKQLFDLHEQLQVERDQVVLTNQLAAEKEKQLVELQQILKSTKEKQSIAWAATEEKSRDVALLQRSSELSEEDTKTNLELELHKLTQEAIATKEELCHYRELSEKLKDKLMVKESTLAHLEEDLREVKKCLSHAEEKLAFYMKREIQEEELQSMSDIDLPHIRSPDWTTSSSQTDRISSVNNSNQTSHIPRKNVGVQNELEPGQLSSSSDEVAELMEQYTEKISQMQELHAAEILDMEARHISEAESLRREQYTIVQALTDECDALKSVIEALKTSGGGGMPDSALSTSYHITDAASSDVGTECDWSQGTFDVQSFDQQPEGLQGDEDDIHTELIPSKIKDLLRAVHQEGMQVLSLTEVTSPEQEPPFTVKTKPWCEERKAMLETIASLKDLIAKMQIHKISESHSRPGFHDLSPDWRGELLRAIQEVFQREQDVLMSAFHTQLAQLGRCDANALLNQMQHRLQEQGMEQINAMDCIQNADRRSLLLEIQDLRAQLTSLHNDPSIQSLFHPNTEAGAALYIQQEQASHSQELHMHLSSMKEKAGELQEQLGSERLLAAEIKNELALTKMELESNIKLQHKHFKELESLRMELKKKREELDSLNETLENEQKKCRELQYVLEKEQTKVQLKDLREKEELEDLQILLEEQKTKNLEISKQLEEEKKLVKDLQEQMESAEKAHDALLSQERSRVLELQVFLDAEKARSAELSNTLECRQDLQAHVQNTETDGHSGSQKPTEDLLKELHGQLDSKHSRIVELVNEVEGYKLECVQLRQTLEEERQSLGKELEAEQEACRLALKQVKELTDSLANLQRQLEDKVAELRRHQTEERQLREAIQRLQNNAQESKDRTSEIQEPDQNSSATRSFSDLGRSTVQHQSGSSPNLLCPDPLSVGGDHGIEGASFSIDIIKQRLQQVAAKLSQLAAKSSQGILFETADDEDLAWSQNSIQAILSQLEHVAILSLQGQNLVLPPGISSNTLTEKLLTQNAELTGYVSRLTEEKKDLQNSLLRLEGELSRYRAREPSGDHSTVDNSLNADVLLTTEREAWSREKLSLHKSLKQAEAELSKVKAELRNEIMQRDLGRDSDNTALKRVYGKYLRSESFRKALIYQKKYLLLLLGGFQECEEATLALIARMGGQPTYTDLEVITNHSRAFTRFRSAARVAIAISRMRFLVRRWQRATISTTNVMNRNSCGQGLGNEVRTDSACHPARSLDRISTCRSQSGFNSPQSTVNSQHRYISASDVSPCFHLQHYDPDRALTDYISRLEALQKRLGSVPSGSSANTTHYSIRR
ncbi:A-kinase anchor protein 9 isoform X4 [Pyxicephalus adspersus]|uniref:A-kinase anchor protein 9 isoform X4 n=1 Tax=Pyxicephalus adspersus TaxID=30357 RepID=UPI003B5BCE20